MLVMGIVAACLLVAIVGLVMMAWCADDVDYDDWRDGR